MRARSRERGSPLRRLRGLNFPLYDTALRLLFAEKRIQVRVAVHFANYVELPRCRVQGGVQAVRQGRGRKHHEGGARQGDAFAGTVRQGRRTAHDAAGD